MTNVKKWNINFIRNAWGYIHEKLKVEINPDTIQFIERIDAVRFSDKDGQKYEMSRSAIQQILLDIVTSEQDKNYDLNPKRKERRGEDPNSATIHSKLVNYYTTWNTKKEWINDKQTIHYAIRSFTRYILRDSVDHFFHIQNKDDSRKEYKNAFGIISRFLHQNIDKSLDFEKIKKHSSKNI